MWVALAASLFCNVVNVNLTLRAADTAHANAVDLCRGIGAVTAQSNRANGSIASVLNQSLTNIQSRANTPKALPSDKDSAKVFIKLIANLRTSNAMRCAALK